MGPVFARVHMHRCARFSKIRPYSKMSDEAFLLLYAVFLATWLQHAPKMLSGRARARTRAHMHRCARFPEKVEISKGGSCEAFLLRPRMAPRCPKMAPKWPQDSPKMASWDRPPFKLQRSGSHRPTKGSSHGADSWQGHAKTDLTQSAKKKPKTLIKCIRASCRTELPTAAVFARSALGFLPQG